MKIKTSILPVEHQFAKKRTDDSLNMKAICIFAATGFFMDDDTYWDNEVCLKPGHTYTLDEEGFVVDSKPWFHWYYEPQSVSFKEALEAYIELFTEIVKEQTQGKKVILPLSGGLDSRSQAKVLRDLGVDVHAFSYDFLGGYPETKIAQKIAQVCGFEFLSLKIPKGYLWDCIDELAQINGCYSEFTHPRQMAVLPELKNMKGVFSLGHWGDVFFDRSAPKGTGSEDMLPLLLKKMVKPGGMELAIALWDAWGLDGDFKSYLISRIEDALNQIAITDVSAKMRAFKTTQWAHRWTTTNLSVFREAHSITLPYYDDRMCEFVCRIPETYLADRKLQLAHLKRDVLLSKITWQAQTPFNLRNFKYNRPPYNLPYRVYDKLKRDGKAIFRKPYIQRNFELQFIGDSNDSNLQSYLFSEAFFSFIPKEVVTKFYEKFKKEDYVQYSHPVSMLLTLSLWNKTSLS